MATSRDPHGDQCGETIQVGENPSRDVTTTLRSSEPPSTPALLLRQDLVARCSKPELLIAAFSCRCPPFTIAQSWKDETHTLTPCIRFKLLNLAQVMTWTYLHVHYFPLASVFDLSTTRSRCSHSFAGVSCVVVSCERVVPFTFAPTGFFFGPNVYNFSVTSPVISAK